MVNKEDIYMVMLKLAAEKGLGAVTLSQIADKVGIRKASLYSHFNSKADIIDGLYEYLRERAKNNLENAVIDYGELVKGKCAEDVLHYVIDSYRKMNQTSEMDMFYRFIAAESVNNAEAARIMVSESERMILAAKQLFYAMQVQGIMEFRDVDMAAFSFAMSVNSIMNLEYQRRTAGMEEDGSILDRYIEWFCGICPWTW